MLTTARPRDTADLAGEPAPRWWPYGIFSGLVMLWAVAVDLHHQWAGDFRLHLGTVFGLSRHLWNPVDPLVGASHDSPYYSPYMLVIALAVKAGLTPRTALEIGGLLSTIFWLWTVRRFCLHLGRSQAIPILAVTATALLWGTKSFIWSGFLGLHSLSWNLGYPSTFAAALMLLSWDLFLRWRERPEGWRTPVLLAVLMALLVLIHPFTAVNTALGLAAFLLVRPGALGPRRLLWLAGAAVAAVALVSAWPWSDLFSLFQGSSDFDAIHRALVDGIVGRNGWERYGLALVALPALVLRWRRPLGREPAGLFVLTALVIAFADVTGRYSLGRAMPVLLLPLHFSLAAYLAESLRGRLTWRTALAAGYAVLALAFAAYGLYAQGGGVVRALPGMTHADLVRWRVPDTGRDYEKLFGHRIGPGDVILLDQSFGARMVNERGGFTVVPGWPYPMVDQRKRAADVARFFAAETTPAERAAIIAEYHVTGIVTSTATSPVLRDGALPGYVQVRRVGKLTLLRPE